MNKNKITPLQPDFDKLITQDGIWICASSMNVPVLVPLWVENGVVYSIKKDQPLSIDRFTKDCIALGPFTEADVLSK